MTISTGLKETYARLALEQIPRLLGNQDRNPDSPTYGCFHRDYWLYKTSDFPDAVRQFAVQALALAYRHDFPGNIYKGQKKIRQWLIAGIDFWTKIQHGDGSFDEFYPFERGWVGPTGFTTYAVTESVLLLGAEIPDDVRETASNAIRRAVTFMSRGESEEDHLANHHAMACLAAWKAYELLQEPKFKSAYQKLWRGFLRYANLEEGWSREYDGADPGYLSATVSFLGKIYQSNRDPELLTVLKPAVEFCSHFVYPNGFYGGSMGSRNTMHFYPDGFEILAREIPLAGSVAERMLQALAEGKLVPPHIMSDRYVAYRVPEFLQAYLNFRPRSEGLPSLPFERDSLQRFFGGARIAAAVWKDYYVVTNLAKGGVVKVFDRSRQKLVLNDCGIIGQLDDGRTVTSQWIDPSFKVSVGQQEWKVSGSLSVVPGNKVFTPLRLVVFRLIALLFGWNPSFSHWLKGKIRRLLMLGVRRLPIDFERAIAFNDKLSITDSLVIRGKERFKSLSIGDEFFVRYVPQSRFFQSQELGIGPRDIRSADIERLNATKTLKMQFEA